MPMQLKGLEKMIKAMPGLERRLIAAAEKALLIEAEKIMTESQLEVPRATGFLANSRFVRAESRPGGPVVFMGYEADYALAVHDVPPNRAAHRAPTKWRFLADPIQRASRGMDERLAKSIKKLAGL